MREPALALTYCLSIAYREVGFFTNLLYLLCIPLIRVSVTAFWMKVWTSENLPDVGMHIIL